jgi:hypothetical protein
LAFRLGREADHSPPSGAEVKECVELYLRSPNTPSWRGAQGAQGSRIDLEVAFKLTSEAVICLCICLFSSSEANLDSPQPLHLVIFFTINHLQQLSCDLVASKVNAPFNSIPFTILAF